MCPSFYSADDDTGLQGQDSRAARVRSTENRWRDFFRTSSEPFEGRGEVCVALLGRIRNTYLLRERSPINRATFTMSSGPYSIFRTHLFQMRKDHAIAPPCGSCEVLIAGTPSTALPNNAPFGSARVWNATTLTFSPVPPSARRRDQSRPGAAGQVPPLASRESFVFLQPVSDLRAT